MWPKLHIPKWSRSRRTSPASGHRASHSESGITQPEGQGARPSGPRCIDTHQDGIYSVQFLSGEKHILVGVGNGTVRQWKVEEVHATKVETLVRSESQFVARAVVSQDGKWVVLPGPGGRTISVWDATTRARVVESTEAHDDTITALDVSRDGSKIASGSRDGTVFVWCLETGRRVLGPFDQGRWITSVQFSPTGDRLASAAPNHTIHVWSMCSGDVPSAAPIQGALAFSLAWSEDGRRIFAGCQSGSIMCFDVSSLIISVGWPARPHSDSVDTLRLSNNGKFMISASSSERCVKIWNVQSQTEIHSLTHASEVVGAEISSDDAHLVTGTKDGKVTVWNLQEVLPTSYFLHSLTVPSRRSESAPILTEISNVAYLAWTKEQLSKAEEMLSSEIERISPSHYDLANRALIRARLQQWDGALDDAQKSLSMKPSLVGSLARILALSRTERYPDVLNAPDGLLENCGQEERDFLDVVKAITLFDAGHHGEAIQLVNDMVIHSHSPDIRELHSFVQAKMHALLAADAANTRQYVEAISLFAQARRLCPSTQYPGLDTLSLISGWVFDRLRLEIYCQSCEACCAAGRLQEAFDAIQKMEMIFVDEINLRSELRGWLTDIKTRCAAMLKNQGDAAMDSKDYDNAITQYSAALAITPAASQTILFVKRSDAQMASNSLEDALKDADAAIRVDPSSPRGYQRKHAVLHKLERYGEAIDALRAIIRVTGDFPDPETQNLRGSYINPSDAEHVILTVFGIVDRDVPICLIDTTNGQLCSAEKRKAIFMEDPIFKELVSAMSTELRRERVDAVTRRYLQYAMLSHRWGAEELEFNDVSNKSIYELGTSPSATKLQRFCQLAGDADYRWCWSDTCCINKDKQVEFQTSIHCMFDWYRGSAATIVYLTGVPPEMIHGALKKSVWMKRGWTLQELLAPRVIRFYYEDWTPYLNNTSHNHKECPTILQELEDATSVPTNELLSFNPGPENVRVKLRLASTRETSKPVDMAYGLFGIFGVTIPVIHGENEQNALGRLFQQIVTLSGDLACISWIGEPSEFNSAFPDHIRVYEHPSYMIRRIEEEDMERRVVELRRTWTSEDEVQAREFYHRLCSLRPADCKDQKLYLPCVVFPLTALRKVKHGGIRTYHASATALEDTEIHTEERFLSREQGPEDLVLVCPWIQELLDATPIRHGRHRQPAGEEGSPSESDSESDGASARGRGTTSVSPQAADDSLSRYLPTDRKDTSLKSSKLAVRFRQPLGALLLLAQGHGQYRRVATDSEIVIRVRDDVSLREMVLETLHVI